jgi:SAM-dependent methyltransferase
MHPVGRQGLARGFLSRVEDEDMTGTAQHDSWSAGRNYDHYMGRWSRLIAREFLAWLDVPENADWADIGCGTGALTKTILETANPKSVAGFDLSEGFVTHARQEIADSRARFEVASAEELPLSENSVDAIASALVLNFVPDKKKALAEFQRVTRPEGTISFYVWDYPGGGMGFIDAFWKAATALDPAAADLDEGARFPFCTPEGLQSLCEQAGLKEAELKPIEVETVFADFNAFWDPFTLGAGPAPGYCMSLSEPERERLRGQLLERLGNGEVRLTARAFAVKARNW